MSGVESEFGTLGWAADWERRPDSNVQENKDKQEPRKLSQNLHLSLQASILNYMDDLQEKDQDILPQSYIRTCSKTWKH